MPLRAVTALNERAFFEQTLEGFANYSIGRNNKRKTVAAKLRAIRACFEGFLHLYPWRASAADADRYSYAIRDRYVDSSLNNVHGDLRQYCAYLCDDLYPWSNECFARFGVRPQRIFSPANTVLHSVRAESPRRPFTDDELARFFGAIRSVMHAAVVDKVKGVWTAARDYALFATLLCFGIRDDEGARMRMTSVMESPIALLRKRYGRHGHIVVEGKAPRRGSKKIRPVSAVLLFDSGPRILRWYIEHIRPHFPGNRRSLFVTERGDPMTTPLIVDAFRTYADLANLDRELSAHCLRHTYATFLRLDGYDPHFVQEQLGHDHLETTDEYTTIGSDFFRSELERAFDELCARGSCQR